MVVRSLFLLAFAALLGCSSSTTSSPPIAEDVEGDSEEDTTLEEDTEPEDTGVVVTDTGSTVDTRVDTKPGCIAPGSPTLCASYSDCCNDAECMSNAGKPARCCYTRLQKVTCGTNEQCCDGYCTDGKCCVPPGKTCALNSMCCSNWCGSQVTDGADGGVKLTSSVCCVPAGNACAGADDCCTKSCVSGKCACLAAGAVVPAYGQALCCSGSYVMVEAGLGYRCK